MCVLQLLSCYPYVHDTFIWRMVADTKPQLQVQYRPRIWKADMDIDGEQLNTQILSYLMSHFDIFTQ